MFSHQYLLTRCRCLSESLGTRSRSESCLYNWFCPTVAAFSRKNLEPKHQKFKEKVSTVCTSQSLPRQLVWQHESKKYFILNSGRSKLLVTWHWTVTEFKVGHFVKNRLQAMVVLNDYCFMDGWNRSGCSCLNVCSGLDLAVQKLSYQSFSMLN